MLTLPPLRDIRDERQREISLEDFSMGSEDFPDFSWGNFLIDSIDLDEIFVGINDGDVLPDLEMDSEMFAEFSLISTEEKAEDDDNLDSSRKNVVDNNKTSSSSSSSSSASITHHQVAEEAVISSKSSSEYSTAKIGNNNLSTKESDKGKKSSSSSSAKQSQNNPQGKRKVKVDWTPELHRRFVQAVEQLGVDKAVPSRILELMGIDCLTRHNIASHLQKYRSHRKHLLAREAEAATWNQKRQAYGGAAATIPATSTTTNGGKRGINTSWDVPTMGFPPMAAPPPVAHFRPLHVWGHPSLDQSLLHAWPKPLAAATSPSLPPPPPPSWTPHPLSDPSFWHAHHHRRFQTPGISNMYKVGPAGVGVPSTPVGRQSFLKPPVDFQPSRESVDAAIGDVLSKPWLPLPLRLKPPSVDGVLAELQKQGISEVP